MKQVIALMLAVGVNAAFLSGCETLTKALTGKPTMDDRIHYAGAHELPTHISNAIINGEITKGMTKQQVIASWGDPCYACYGTRENSYGDSWEYNVFGTGSQGAGGGTYVYFNSAGKVIGWSGP